MKITEIENENNIGVQVVHKEEGHDEKMTTENITFITGFQTSEDPLFVGAMT